MTAQAERVLIVVPALNEERSVGDVVTTTRDLGYDVCVVDDGSTDATADRARAAGAVVLQVPLNLGVGGALRCGFRWALAHGYDVAVQLDADGQHDPHEIAALLACMRETGADLVIGSRFVEGAGAYAVRGARRFAMALLARRAARATGTYVADSTSGFRAIGRPLLDRFAADYPVEYLGDTVEALIEAGRAGARIVEHPISASPRAHGSGSAGVAASTWYVARVLLATELMHNRRRRPPHSLPSTHGVS
ncbi:MAG TPA: glycosyltransferase family 2 protein [Conexibacter sp.]|jgi:glycosyltransferase involved in cell wall biosynthesis|nr:glycosyltransferase family 2 protein [Conexibacter sp.]